MLDSCGGLDKARKDKPSVPPSHKPKNMAETKNTRPLSGFFRRQGHRCGLWEISGETEAPDRSSLHPSGTATAPGAEPRPRCEGHVLHLRSSDFLGRQGSPRISKNTHTHTHNITQYHTISHNITQYHTISHNITQYHTISHNLTQSHTISHNLTQSHTISHNHTLTHTQQNHPKRHGRPGGVGEAWCYA